MFVLPKRSIKMAAVMLLLPTEATVEEKINMCMDQLCPTYCWRPEIIQQTLALCIKTDHN